MTALTELTENQPTADEYPTRTDREAALLYRTHPVVWAEADGPYEAEDLDSYANAGYLQHRCLFDTEEASAFAAELRRIDRDPDLRGDERLARDPEDASLRCVYEAHRISDVFTALVRDPRLVERARQILGSDVYVHQSRVTHMPAFGGGDFWWHSDFETWHAEDGMAAPRAVSFAISLSQDMAHNGALMVMPGSHRTYVSCVGATPQDHYDNPLKAQESGIPDQTSLAILAKKCGVDVLTGGAGDTTMMDSNCMHASAGNITPFARSEFFVVFNSVDNTCTDPFAADAPRPAFLGSREFNPV